LEEIYIDGAMSAFRKYIQEKITERYLFYVVFSARQKNIFSTFRFAEKTTIKR